MFSPETYELPGSFFLGGDYDLANRKLTGEPTNYDSKDLVTHALCVGMTGSGKTGLCLALLEEAAIDGIPAICIDPKGDLGNLLLTFPDLKGEDFEPWVDRSEAAQKNLSTQELGQSYADLWRKGLDKWGEAPERIAKFRDSTDVTIYTPGSNIGVPLTVLKSFDAPGPEVLADGETFREKITSAASGLLTLLSMDADPLTSREHILLSKILETAWMAGKSLSLADIIRNIQVPPIDRIGVIDLESFFPSDKRSAFAMQLNNLLASPAFAGWLEGEALNIKRLLYGDNGKPRMSIISIAHLSDSERMFFVTIFLGELLSWMRSQPGTGSLRALFYMDEVYGYFPPSAKPPSKPPMLTLLKQARAFGLGIVLATQNPVDLDYKGLSNIGTWFLGRLQTDRDKQRVLDGLEGAALQGGGKFDRAEMERTLAALGSRVFLMNNVHQEQQVIFQSRWALSFLRGPLSREQIIRLMHEKRTAAKGSSGVVSPNSSPTIAATSAAKSSAIDSNQPVVPGDVTQKFWQIQKFASPKAKLVYLPALLGQATVHFVRSSVDVDQWQQVSSLLPTGKKIPASTWEKSEILPPGTLQLASQPEEGFGFAGMSIDLAASRNFKGWQKDLQDYLYRTYQAKVYYAPALDRYSKLGQSDAEASYELSQNTREARDEQAEELKQKYAAEIQKLQAKIEAAKEKLSKEESEAKGHFYDSIVQVGTSILGAFIGRKKMSQTNMRQMSAAARKMSQVSSERGDVNRANQRLEDLQADREDLERRCKNEIEDLRTKFRPESLELQATEVPCRKGDMQLDDVTLLWVPFVHNEDGTFSPLVQMSDQAVAAFNYMQR